MIGDKMKLKEKITSFVIIILYNFYWKHNDTFFYRNEKIVKRSNR